MHSIVQNKLNELGELCTRHHVSKLELFGSAADGAFDPAKSDLDFVVEFRGDARHGLSGDHIGLKDALRILFGRDVDLVMVEAIRNPYFAKTIAESRVTVYAR
jgi:hypothetical protein